MCDASTYSITFWPIADTVWEEGGDDWRFFFVSLSVIEIERRILWHEIDSNDYSKGKWAVWKHIEK